MENHGLQLLNITLEYSDKLIFVNRIFYRIVIRNLFEQIVASML